MTRHDTTRQAHSLTKIRKVPNLGGDEAFQVVVLCIDGGDMPCSGVALDTIPITMVDQTEPVSCVGPRNAIGGVKECR